MKNVNQAVRGIIIISAFVLFWGLITCSCNPKQKAPVIISDTIRASASGEKKHIKRTIHRQDSIIRAGQFVSHD